MRKSLGQIDLSPTDTGVNFDTGTVNLNPTTMEQGPTVDDSLTSSMAASALTPYSPYSPSIGTPLPGYGYGPSPSGGVALYPTAATIATSPTIVSTASPFAGLSTTEILLGAGGFLLLILAMGGRRR